VLSYEVDGDGPPLLLLHGTMSSRRVWAPVREALARERRLVLIDLPGMGDSPPIAGAHVPAAWLGAIGDVLDAVDAERPAVVGHSMGAWTALELARAGRAASVLALAPAGLWERSPRAADISLLFGRAMSRVMPPRLTARALEVAAVRRVALHDASVDGRAVPAAWAAALAADGRRSTGFGEHFRAARRDRFRGGGEIDVPVRVVFAQRDRIATPVLGQLTDELPEHAVIERWPGGHMLMWDATDRVIEAAMELQAAP
jgi:pimeloyl-ACP methyl ester carboxylesterase